MLMSSGNPLVQKYLASIGVDDGADRTQIVKLVRAVASIPWGEGRTIEEVLESKRVGTCTGKHLVLMACCDMLHIPYRVTVCRFRWSEQSILLPKHLVKILEEGEWLHGHNFVQLQNASGAWMDIDITWDAPLKPSGFLTFPSTWDGESPWIGVQSIDERIDNADLTMKQQSIHALSPEIRERRELFLREFFVWVQSLRV